MKVKSESEVAQSCPTLCNPMDCRPPGSSAHEIFQARVLEWGAIAFSEGSSIVLYNPWCVESVDVELQIRKYGRLTINYAWILGCLEGWCP